MHKPINNQRFSLTDNIVLWTLQVAASAAFLMVGLAKLTGNPLMVETFKHVGIDQGFRYATGLIEIVSAVLILIPRVTPIGATLLIYSMIGAVAAHLNVLNGSPVPALVLLCFSGIILCGRFRTIDPALRKLFAVAKVVRADAMSPEHRAAMSNGYVNLPSRSHT